MEERRGSDSIWFDLKRMEAELTEERAMQKCDTEENCFTETHLLQRLPTTSLSKNRFQLDLWKGGDPLMRFLAPECSQGEQCCQV